MEKWQTNPEKHEKNIGAFITYTLNGTDILEKISRRYSDFYALYEKLVQRWPGVYIPRIPPKLIAKNTSADIEARVTKQLNNTQEGIRLITPEPRVKLIAHRGLEYYAPEATIPAYTIAGQKGMWGCKLDICETADGKFVMSHDTTVDRMFDGTGSIISKTLEQLQGLTVDAGNHIEDYPNEKIVTLEEALVICKKYGMHPYIEFKNIVNKTSVQNVLDIIEKQGLLEATCYQCSDGNRNYMYWLRSLNKDIPIVFWKSSNITEGTYSHIIEPLGNALFSYTATMLVDESVPQQVSIDHGLPIATAINASLSGAKNLVENYAVSLIVTDRVTPAELAPEIYPVE